MGLKSLGTYLFMYFLTDGLLLGAGVYVGIDEAGNPTFGGEL